MDRTHYKYKVEPLEDNKKITGVRGDGTHGELTYEYDPALDTASIDGGRDPDDLILEAAVDFYNDGKDFHAGWPLKFTLYRWMGGRLIHMRGPREVNMTVPKPVFNIVDKEYHTA